MRLIIGSVASVCLCCPVLLYFWRGWPRNFIFGMHVHPESVQVKFVSRSSGKGQGHRKQKMGYTSVTEYIHWLVVRLQLKGILIFRPPEIVVGGLTFYHGFFLLSLFFRGLISELAERNLMKIGHMLGSKSIWKRMSKIWDIPSPTNWGQNHLLWRTSQHSDNFNGLYLRNETRYRQSGKHVANYKESPVLSQNDMNFGPQTASNWTAILPTLRKFCVSLYCHASQTEISKWNSTKLFQTVDSKSR